MLEDGGGGEEDLVSCVAVVSTEITQVTYEVIRLVVSFIQFN